MTALHRVRLGAGALLLTACAHATILGHGANSDFDQTLMRARALADAGHFDESDRALELYAIQHANSPDAIEALYWRAVFNLDPANQLASLDTATAELDEYLSAPRTLQHLSEATALRSLARDAQQLNRVQVALRQARAEARASNDQSSPPSGDEASKEVQRLRDELAAANAELDRIKKRLANPKP